VPWPEKKRPALEHEFVEAPIPPLLPEDDELPPPPGDDDDPNGGGGDNRKLLNIREDELLLATEAWNAIVEVPLARQRLFLWNDELVSIRRRKDGTIGQRVVTGPELRLRVAEQVRWCKYVTTGRGFEAKPAHAPGTTIAAMRDSPDPRLPEIVTLTTIPIFSPGGKLIRERGYDVSSGVFAWPTCDVPPVSERPSATELAEMTDVLFGHLLHDFPFVRPSDRAHAVAALLTPFVRLMIDGATPLFLFESPTPGSGKGRIPEVASIVVTGSASQIKLSSNDDENEKKFLALLKSAPSRIMCLDNVDINLRSSMLALTLTATHIEGRILGLSEGVVARNLATWMMTSNNPDASQDINRRALVVRIDPGMEHPDQRPASDFVVPNLIPWAHANRGKIAWALLTMVQHWIATGAKRSPISMGSFEEFSGIVGGILAANGVQGFLQNRGAEDPRSHDEWKDIVALWAIAFGDRVVNAGDVLQEILDHKLECSCLVRTTERGQLTAFGSMLRRQADRVIGGYRIAREGTGWRLVQVEARRAPTPREREPGEDDIDVRSPNTDAETWDFRN